MKKNLYIGYFLAFVNELYFPIAVWLLFFLQYMDFTQVAIIGALTTISSNVFEIPTGAIADLIGRKWTLFWSFLISSIGLLIISSGNVFIIFAIGRIVNGLGTSLFSGTHESLMYDTLKEGKLEHTYDHVVSKVETITWIGLFIAAVIGGFIYDVWNKGPFIISSLIYFLAAIMCIFLTEPRIDSEKFNLKVYLKQNLKGFKELFKNKKTAQISLLLITVSAGYFIAAKILGISQAEQYGLTGKGIGILFGSGYIIAALFSHAYPSLRKKVGNAQLLVFATLCLLASFILARFVSVLLGSVLIIIRIASSTTFGNAKSVIMNRFIESKNRATAISTARLLSEIPFTLTFFVIGKYIDMHSPNEFALLLGLILTLFLLPQVYLFRQKKSRTCTQVIK